MRNQKYIVVKIKDKSKRKFIVKNSKKIEFYRAMNKYNPRTVLILKEGEF